MQRLVTLVTRFEHSPLYGKLQSLVRDAERCGLQASANAIRKHLTRLTRRVIDRAIR